MTPPANSERYKNHRFPGEIISHGVWLYYRFPLSYRDVQELLFERGIDVTHEAIRQWCLKFGQDYANRLKRRRAQAGDKWHLDEVFLTINGERHDLWRAVDQDDNVLDILVQSRRNKQAAKKFFRKLLKGLRYVERVAEFYWRSSKPPFLPVASVPSSMLAPFRRFCRSLTGSAPRNPA